MKERKSDRRTQWIHIRVKESEYKSIERFWKQTTSPALSEYVRNTLLQKPVLVNYRNQSADDILAEMIRLKNELNAIGNNFNQAVHQLHTLDTVPQIRIWLLANENLKNSFLQKTEEIR